MNVNKDQKKIRFKNRYFFIIILKIKRWKEGELLGIGSFGKVVLGLNKDNGSMMAV